MAEWFSIEVFNGTASARAWMEGYGDPIVVAAQGQGVTDWEWHTLDWGVVLEVELPDEAAWEALQAEPAVRAALDAVPDPVHGVLLHRGRGGSSGSRWPRRPRPFAGAGAMSLPEPIEQEWPEADERDAPVAVLVRT